MIVVEDRSWDEMLEFQKESELLLDATLNLDGDLVAKQLEKIHNEYMTRKKIINA